MACIFCDKPCVFSGVAKRRAKKTIFYRIKQCGMTFLPCGDMLHGLGFAGASLFKFILYLFLCDKTDYLYFRKQI